MSLEGWPVAALPVRVPDEWVEAWDGLLPRPPVGWVWVYDFPWSGWRLTPAEDAG